MKTEEKETKVLICRELHDRSCALGCGLGLGHTCTQL